MSKSIKGRGTSSNHSGRYESLQRTEFDDGWDTDHRNETLNTRLHIDHARKLITYNDSPDLAFDRSINPYRGCEHGCAYCFARPTHAYLGLSPGLDFESQLFYKPDAVQCLVDELSQPGYQAQSLALGVNTDAYQPVERELNITRQLVRVLHDFQHPTVIITKSALVLRDLDLLQSMARNQLLRVVVSLCSLDTELLRKLEPRASAAHRRVKLIEQLTEAGIDVSVLMAPVIPALNDHEIERLLEGVKQAGARSVSYILIRLPLEIKSLMHQWLRQHVPLKAERIIERVRDCHFGKDYHSAFGHRQRGSGPIADLIAQRFKLASKRFGFADPAALNCEQFHVPHQYRKQMSLF